MHLMPPTRTLNTDQHGEPYVRQGPCGKSSSCCQYSEDGYTAGASPDSPHVCLTQLEKETVISVAQKLGDCQLTAFGKEADRHMGTALTQREDCTRDACQVRREVSGEFLVGSESSGRKLAWAWPVVS